LLVAVVVAIQITLGHMAVVVELVVIALRYLAQHLAVVHQQKHQCLLQKVLFIRLLLVQVVLNIQAEQIRLFLAAV
jgi:hypothetical protein